MRLIGMLDSPFVRRVAISLQLLDLRFEHESLSVFRTFEQFREINPLVKAPTLVCDDGTVLMDSPLILEYAEALAAPHKSLMPKDIAQRRQALRFIGLAMTACEKSVQRYYEQALRPEEKQHAPWLDRVTEQLLTAFGVLESELQRHPLAVSREAIDQAGITTAVAWHFTQAMHPGFVSATDHPALQAFSEQVEALPEFKAAPHGDSTYRQDG